MSTISLSLSDYITSFLQSADEWSFGDDVGSGIRGKSHLNGYFQFSAELKMTVDDSLQTVQPPISFDARFWSKGNCPR
jgi:hypothetical protein